MNMCTLENAHMHAQKHTSACMVGFERQGQCLQQMAAGPRAKSKYGRQNHNCCQSRDDRDVEGPKRPFRKQSRRKLEASLMTIRQTVNFVNYFEPLQLQLDAAVLQHIYRSKI